MHLQIINRIPKWKNMMPQFRAVHTKYIGAKLEISYVCWYEPSVETQAGILQDFQFAGMNP